MGNFDLGGLFASASLDDSQFTAGIDRSKAGAVLLTSLLGKLRAELLSMAPELIKAGASLEDLAIAFGVDAAAAKEQIATLAIFQQKLNEFGAVIGRVSSQESGLAAQRVKRADQEAEAAAISASMNANYVKMYTTLLKEKDAADAKYEADFQKLVQEEIAANIERANQEAQATSIMAANERAYTAMFLGLLEEREAAAATEATERVTLANQIAIGEARADAIGLAEKKAAINARILLANQYAEAEVRSAAIANEAQLGNVGLRLTPSGLSPRGFIGAGSSGLLAAGAAVFGAFELTKMVEQSAAAAREISNLGDRLDITTQEAYALQQAAKLTGVDIGSLQQSAFHLAQALEEGSGAGKKTADALESIGVTGHTSGELLENTLLALSKISDHTERLDKLRDIFQRQSQTITPYIDKLTELNALVGIFGNTLSDKMTAELNRTATSFALLGIAWENFKMRTAAGPVGQAAGTLATGTSILLSTDFLNPFTITSRIEAAKAAEAQQGANEQSKALAAKALADAQQAAKAFRDMHANNLEALKEDLAKTIKEIKQLNEELGSVINPIMDPAVRTLKGGEVNALMEQEAQLRERIKALAPGADDKAATKATQQAAQLEEAQTALSKFAEAYNSNFQLLSADQRAFIEGSFTGLNDLLGKGASNANLSTFKAELGKFSESLKEFTANAKVQLESEKLTESVDVMTNKFVEAEGKMSAAEFAYLNALFGQIDQLVKAGTDPRLIAPLIKEFNDKLSESSKLGAALSSESITFGTALEHAFRLGTAEAKDTNAQISEMMRNLTAVKQLQVTNPQMAALLQDQFRQSQLRGILGLGRNNNTAGQLIGSTAEFLSTTAPLDQKQNALVKFFEEIGKISGKSAEAVSQNMKVMVDGVVQDYDALKDQLKSRLGIIGQAWNDLMGDMKNIAEKTVGALGGALFDTFLPNFTNPSQADPLKPLVDSFRSAFEQLSAFSSPKQALTDVIASIQKAGTVAQANAIAVRFFGTTAGPLLASELRNGTLSATDLKKAIDAASLSTVDFANQSTTSISALSTLWRTAIRDIVIAITERLIIAGLLKLLEAMGIIHKGTNTLASAMDEIFTKLTIKIAIMFKKMGTDIIAAMKQVAQEVTNAINGIYATATVVIRTIYETVGSPGGGGGGGGGGLDPNLFGGGGIYNGGFGGFPGVGFNNDGFSDAVSAGSPGAISHSRRGGVTIAQMTVVTQNPVDFVRQLKNLRLT